MAEYEELDHRFKESLLNWMKTNNQFWTFLGMEILDVRRGWAKIRLPFSEKLTNGIGVALHYDQIGIQLFDNVVYFGYE